ncbi:histidine phosphatase family protein [Streptomyces goshikiensis]
MVSDLLLVRHGETEWSANGRHTGLTDVPLTPNGVEEAISLAPYFRDRRPDLVLTSPLRRAVVTAELAGLSGGRSRSRPVRVGLRRLRGRHHRRDPADPTVLVAVDRRGPARRRGAPGESADQVGARADRALARVAPVLRADGGGAVVVAHGHFLRVLTARYLGLPPADGRLFLLRTGTVSVLSTEHGLPVIAGWNTHP